MWRPSGNRGGNRGSSGRGGSQSASPWPDANNGRQGRRGYGENQNNQYQQKSKNEDPRNHVGMSFRGSGRPVTRPEAPMPNANSSSGGLGKFCLFLGFYLRIGFRDESTRTFQSSTSQKCNLQYSIQFKIERSHSIFALFSKSKYLLVLINLHKRN